MREQSKPHIKLTAWNVRTWSCARPGHGLFGGKPTGYGRTPAEAYKNWQAAIRAAAITP